MVEGWKYYKQAAVPTTAPHRPPNLEPIKNGTIWKDLGGVHHFLLDIAAIGTVDTKQTGGM